MRTHCSRSMTSLLVAMQLIAIQLFAFSGASAAISMTVNGQANGASFPQGSAFSWSISGLANGATVSNELWIDLNTNGVIDYATDLLFVGFSQKDGVAGGNQGPGDDDATANGTITTSMSGLYFPVAHYVFKTKSGTDSATSSYEQTAIVGPTFSVSGKVTQNAIGKPNVAVTVQTQNNGEYYALTNATGDYSIVTNLASGTPISVRVPIEDFNSNLRGLIVSPAEANFNLTANISNVNFTLAPGKIVTGLVTDTLGNPIFDMAVDIYPSTGGNGYNGRTDMNGRYFITVDTGTYVVRFGSDQEPKGFIKTYYNQKYVGWMTDYIHVSLATDTLKNINAVLRRGGLIMGTFIKDGVSVRGNISAWAFNTPGNPLYETWHNETDNFYYLVVPPGTYTIQFNLDGAQQQAYYNQSIFWPGTPVTISSFSDTAKNVNINFSTLPKQYTFIGFGDWNIQGNWQNGSKPPSPLPAGDYIFINGGQCTLSGSQIIAPGANLIVRPGSNLIVTGNLLRQ